MRVTMAQNNSDNQVGISGGQRSRLETGSPAIAFHWYEETQLFVSRRFRWVLADSSVISSTPGIFLAGEMTGVIYWILTRIGSQAPLLFPGSGSRLTKHLSGRFSVWELNFSDGGTIRGPALKLRILPEVAGERTS